MKKSFFEEGIRFQCQGSGQCCSSRGEYGYVYLNLEDRKRFARHFKVLTREFTRKYCGKHNGHFHLKEERDPRGTAPCRFLDGKSCTVYPARPNQCRTWPFWPENMNARAWSREVKAFCPGVGKGKLYTKEEIRGFLALDPVDPQ